ncbi:MAG TPA: response regulator [Candidatus Thermoplasmatota archaeon]|nr:response regulator [Candidatus Thermoplasmatota archaeon]
MTPLPSSPPRRTLLLVDDEPDILRSIGPLLERGIPGLEVIPASSGREGLAILDRGAVDLIVSDFRMPGMDGLEFLEQCGLRHPRIPRAILTAFLTQELRERAGSGVASDSFLSKAEAPSVLLDWVRRRIESVPAAAVASLMKVKVGTAPQASAPME